MEGSERHVRDWRAGLLTDEELLAALQQPGRATGPVSDGLVLAVVLAGAAAVAVQVARLQVGATAGAEWWFVRHASLLVLPFVTTLLLVRRRAGAAQVLASTVPYLLALIVVGVLPIAEGSATGILIVTHLPVLLWAALVVPHSGGRLRSRRHRLDFVRFSGNWAIMMVLIALGGIVLVALTLLVLAPTGVVDVERLASDWIIPSGVVGAVVIAAWLVEARPRVVDQVAPVLTTIFLPLFAVMIVIATIVHAVNVTDATFDRELLVVLDVLMVVVVALVLFATVTASGAVASDALRAVGLVAVVAALVLDVLVLGTMLARISELGPTPNRAAALGLNIVLLVTLAGTAWWSARGLAGRAPLERLERWLADALVLLVAWIAIVVLVLPVVFGQV
jgi:hypothetical protein